MFCKLLVFSAAELGLHVCEMNSAVVTCYKGGLIPCGKKLEKQDIWVREGRIVDPQQLFFRECKSPDYIINCSNHIVAPGFIDIQINGGYIPNPLCGNHGRVLVCDSLFGAILHGLECRWIWYRLFYAEIREFDPGTGHSG